jgi:hypothetical protein
MSVLLFLVPSLGIWTKIGVVHSSWCATKVNFVASGAVFLPSQFSGIGFATAPQLRTAKASLSPHNQVQHMKPMRARSLPHRLMCARRYA